MSCKRVLILALITICAIHARATASPNQSPQQEDVSSLSKIDSATVAQKLSSQNPLERRAAAEYLARLAAVEHRRLVEGYRVQEKDTRVRLAMDWALYRMGKNESLFMLVRALDEKKLADQSVSYLKQLEGPDPLYVFFGHVNGNTQIRLLEALAAVGDRSTLERIKPFAESTDPGIANAAKFAEREINIRLDETPAVETKRPRKVGETTDNEQPPT
jgi:HEAT repeat protein